MPEAISSLRSSVCDPEMASCTEVPPTAAGPAVVEVEPVVVTGDAGAQEVLRRYDASRACGNEKQALALSCPGIGTGVLNALEGGPLAGIATAFLTSMICGRDLRALVDCQSQAATLESSAAEAVGSCHDRGGTVSNGESPKETICEVGP